MMILTAIISGLLLIASAIIFNLLNKNEKLEEMVLNRDEIIHSFKETTDFINLELKRIDEKGAFKSDDEIGFFFKKIIALQEILDSHFKK